MALIKKFRVKSYKSVEPIVELKNISVFYNKRQIIDNLNLKINKQEILGLLGPNGVGKSTIFNLITGLKDPNYGEIYIDGIKSTKLPINERFTKFKLVRPEMCQKNFAGNMMKRLCAVCGNSAPFKYHFCTLCSYQVYSNPFNPRESLAEAIHRRRII